VSCSSNDVKVVVVQPQGLAGSGIVSWLSFSESGFYIALGGGRINGKSFDGIAIYDCTKDKIVLIWEPQDWNSNVYGEAVAFHPFNSSFVFCCDQEHVGLVNWKEGKKIFRLPIEHGFVSGVAFSKDGSCVFVIHSFFAEKKPEGWNEEKQGPFCIAEILKIDIESQKIVKKIIVDNNKIHGVDFNPNRNLVALRYLNGKAEIWDLEEGRCLKQVQHFHGDKCIKFIDDDTFLTDGFPRSGTATGVYGNVILWNLKTGTPIRKFSIHSMDLNGGIGILYDKKGNKYILSSGNDNYAKLWNLDTGKIIWSKYYKNGVKIGVSPDGKKGIISTNKDNFLIYLESQ
jgi:WD40 repeat protein